ncbi:hypothetical protein IMCC3317_02850 [Kordia antarctica]|uniref:Uncharacterized protein n=1 Tax=Kordia antarctica TaxID=1218801 RepID=A0A7L4ZEK5_9FLAO|nr:hypothetical protein [Kordia antarctica]QHI34940.1 hypothetical protein IMCC3317_02850 [Kordia antarctica]
MIKKIFKILGKLAVGIIVILLLLFTFVYFKYNESLPKGVEGAEADALATKMLVALKHEEYKNTRYLSWTFPGGHHYVWDKDQHKVDVSWSNTKVNLNLKQPTTSLVTIGKKMVEGNSKSNAIEKALSYFNNDSFWLVAPYKVFDEGVTRSIVTKENDEKALLITYNSGGTTPGDSYLWTFDENEKPKGYQMWVSIIPIGGLYASWDNWETMESGIPLATLHTLLIVDLDLKNVKAWN